ncbi:hypothetical protein AJ80_01317 [Polytolypa hystricis UAMH7299]|uniref:Non-reducing polyketide synthase nscA n=1 Tax=Polytolypa hystricis (strain UAMH7299) TaxID=1447883 RepID=A0A2B7Z015_POLH7|nr:hypothetical protein AJ80_01317 [Polytolypa hystricis UAMH7299]
MGDIRQPGNLRSSDIAVVGLACRFPGSASNASKFWELLYNKQSAYSEVPSSRYNVDAFHHPASNKINTLSARGGHFLDQDIAAFDAPFFNITANEAKAMDPNARMLLEVTYEALENAGIPIESLTGSDTSCYVGCFTRDYHEIAIRDAETSPMYAGTGTGFSLLSNRVSWFYDFRGPSMTLDTACSSSLVALHLACQDLRIGESKVAVVSGANLILSPDLAMWLANLNMTSKDGLSRSFAEGTSGYGRGEGIATVILKPLADAVRDGDSIRAVIRGTGVNQDGHTVGITLPNSDAQAALIRSTYRSAGLDCSDTTYFEAHGTGTAAGDPLELGAVAQTISGGREQGNELLVGSVKSNIGHLEGAAGLAGVIKCILMLENDMILPNIHFDKPNSRIPFDKWKIRVPTSVSRWPSNALRRVSVNSFGYGGANAHAILDSTDQFLRECGIGQNHKSATCAVENKNYGDETIPTRKRLFIFSAHDATSLERMMPQLSSHLEVLETTRELVEESKESCYLDSLAHTLSNRRSQLVWKTYVVASAATELKATLSTSGLKAVRASNKPRIAFIFTGQGAQWAKMGLGLIQYPIFKASIVAADSYLKETLGSEWSVMEELEREETNSNIHLAKISQPICTILQVALVELLRSWGVHPGGAVGHSSGEIAAAYASGAISRENAWAIAYWRGKVCSELHLEAPHLKASMMAAGLSSDEAQAYINTVTSGMIVVACINSPSSVTISGDEKGIDELQEKLKVDSVFCRKLKIENAYHSHHMELVAEKYLQKIKEIRPDAPSSKYSPKMVSSVTGRVISHADMEPEYWVRNLVSPVLFSAAVESLLQDTSRRRRRAPTSVSAFDFLLEIGPHSALKGPLRQILQHLEKQNVEYQSLLLRGEDAVKTALEAVGMLYIHGAPVAISEANNIQRIPQPLTNLPSYPWNRSLTYWSESRLSKNYRFRKHGRHDLLGAPTSDSTELEPRWRHFLRVSENPWIRDHVVQSSILYPGSGAITMVLEAAQQIADQSRGVESFKLKDVHIAKAIVVPDDSSGIEVFLNFRRQKTEADSPWNGWWEFTICTGLDYPKIEENGYGLVKVQYKADLDENWTTSKSLVSEAFKNGYRMAKEVCTRPIDPKTFYQATQAAGLTYGPSFQGLTEISSGNDRCRCIISVPDTKRTMPEQIESPHLIHPTTLDVVFHSLFAAIDGGDLKTAVPISFSSITVSADLPTGAGSQFLGFCHTTRDGPRELLADIYMSDIKCEEPIVQVKGMRCREVPGSANTDSQKRALKAPLGTLLWKPDIELLSPTSSVKALEQYAPNVGTLNDVRNLTNDSGYPTGLIGSICTILDLATYKNPGLSILQIGRSELITDVLDVLGKEPGAAPRFANYMQMDYNLEIIEKTDFKDWGPRKKYHFVDSTVRAEDQIFQDESFDFIFIITDSIADETKANFLRNARKMLRNDGRVVIGQHGNSAFGNSWEEHLVKSGFKPLELAKRLEMHHEFHRVTVATVSNPDMNKISDNHETIYILLPSSHSDRTCSVATEITNVISGKGYVAESALWPPDLEKLKGKQLISLLEMEESMFAEISAADFDTLKTLVLQTSQMLWVSQGDDPVMSAAMGYLRSLQNENLNLNLRYLCVENRLDRSLGDLARIITKVARAPGFEREFSEINGELCINRWIPDLKLGNITMESGTLGKFEQISLGESCTGLKPVIRNPEQPEDSYFVADTSLPEEIFEDEVDVEVLAIGLNSSSAKTQAMQYPSLAAQEISGVIRKVGKGCSRLSTGDRVYAVATGPCRSILRTKGHFCQRIPADATFEETACWPLTFGAAYQSLVKVARLRPGQSILIQSGAGAIGQALIQFAARCGATIFATVSTEEQRRAVESYDIPKDRILWESEVDLCRALALLSGGRGFDVIVHTHWANTEIFNQMWSNIAKFGVFIDIQPRDASNKGALDISPFQSGASFSRLDMDIIVERDPSLMSEILQGLSMLLQGSLNNTINALNVLDASMIGKAYSLAQDEETIGKVVVSFGQKDQILIAPSATNPLLLDRNASYVLAGGLGGLGRSLARLLADNGARHLVFISRSGLFSPNARSLTDELRALGVEVRIFACDISDETAMERVVSHISAEMPPVRGVIQSAAVLKDSIYENMTHEQWVGVIRPKIQGSWLLHKLLPRDMQFFVMLSSISGVLGNRSQANYATGNAYQDALAAYRRKNGLPAVSVDLGLMLGIGLIAERGGATNLRKWDAAGINETEFHALMKAAMVGSYGKSAIPAQLVTGLPTGGIIQQYDLETPFYFDNPRFSLLKRMDLDSKGGEVDDGTTASESLSSLFSQCSSLHEVSRLISTALCEKIAKGLQTTPENIDTSKPLHSYGVDSLMAVELRSWIIANIKAEISLFDMLSGISIAGLAVKMASSSKLVPAGLE